MDMSDDNDSLLLLFLLWIGLSDDEPAVDREGKRIARERRRLRERDRDFRARRQAPGYRSPYYDTRRRSRFMSKVRGWMKSLFVGKEFTDRCLLARLLPLWKEKQFFHKVNEYWLELKMPRSSEASFYSARI